ncbi:MAG: ATP-binding protein [Planctomycetota bacterium]
MDWLLSILLVLALIAVAFLTVAHRGQLRVLRTLRRSDQELTAELRERLASETARRNELEALLASMTEGVLAVDLSGRLININRAGADLLRLSRERVLGQDLLEVVRNTRIAELLRATLDDQAPQHDEFELSLAGDALEHPRMIQAQTATLLDGDQRTIGALVVVHDVTQLRRLEAVRSDFVANVSHEVKTPVAAIKAAVETLLDDHDSKMPQTDREKFERMIARQADRLDAIVEDLLSLARIEQDPQDAPHPMEPHQVWPVLEAAIETCAPKAQTKSIQVTLECPSILSALMRANLVEQAIVNLIDNAIKYSEPGTAISVNVSEEQDDVVIAVRDQGRGIESQHLSRVFERFYRTDRSRSRAMGGTGLGLSIVKHIAVAHGGRVGVESRPGLGSTFRLYLRGAHGDTANDRTAPAMPPAA